MRQLSDHLRFPEGIASRVYTYDKEGQLTETRYYSAGGAPVSKDT